MASFTAGSLCCGTRAAGLGRRSGIPVYCRCSFVVLKHSVVSKLEFDGMGFVTGVLYDISSLQSNR